MVLRRAVLAACLLLWPVTAAAQVYSIPDTPVHVICDAGTCGGGSAFNDGSAFTGGSTPVNIFAGVFDDALADATAGTAVAARLTNKRALHINLRDAAGVELGTATNPIHITGGAGGGSGDGAILDGVNATIKATVTGANALKVDGSAVTQPVSGTFYQATQPVSGTFWQATQPVSGTFWQATQPVSGPLTDTQLRASAVPVSGTFWQATQPVSGTFWQATQPVSGTVTAVQPTGSNLHIQCDSGCGGAASFSDNSAFTAGTTAVNVSGGVFNDGLAAVTSGNAAAPRITTQRGLHVNLRNNAGTEIGTSSTPVRIDPTGTTSQPQIGVEANVGTASWTSATSINTDVQVVSTAYSVGVTQITVSGGVPTAGIVTLEGSTDNGTTWKTLLHYSPDFSCGLCTGYVSKVVNTWDANVNGTGSGTQYVASVGGYSKYRARLSTVIAGSGTVSIRIYVASADPAYLAVYAPQDLPVRTGSGVVLDVNTKQINGATVSTAASGVQKVGIVGNAGAALDAANNAAMPANAEAIGLQTATIDTSPTAATAGNLRYQLASTEGVAYVQEGGPKRFSCLVQGATVTTQCQAAPGAGLRAYVTSVTMSNQAATAQTLDVVFGTGSNCATGTAALTHKVQFGTNATTTSPQSYGMQFQTPLVPTAANAICVRPSAGSAFGATITGYIAP